MPFADYITVEEAAEALSVVFDLGQRKWDLIGWVEEAKEYYEKTHSGGAIFNEEGALLYILVRALCPRHIVELGTFTGKSTNFIVRGFAATGRKFSDASITTVERNKNLAFRESLKADRNAGRIKLLHLNAIDYMEKLQGPIDFVFEDTDHTLPTTKRLALSAKRVLSSGGILVSHDARLLPTKYPNTPRALGGKPIQDAYRQAGLFEETLFLTVASRKPGLAIWRKP